MSDPLSRLIEEMDKLETEYSEIHSGLYDACEALRSLRDSRDRDQRMESVKRRAKEWLG